MEARRVSQVGAAAHLRRVSQVLWVQCIEEGWSQRLRQRKVRRVCLGG